jgi:L-seryl-tRNA(Ser) seleniumtransferase
VAIKPPELLNRLPSVSDLLEKPPVRALADRWNRSTVAAGVRSFLDELRSDLRRRAADVQLPSIRELAERAARYIVLQQQQSLGTAINATGRIWGTPWNARPLADTALERTIAVGREFAIENSSAAVGTTAGYESLVCRLTGAQAAIAVHSYSGAMWLALSAVAADRDVLVARAEVGNVGPSEPLPILAASAKVFLREVGTINRVLATEYEAALSPRAAAILRLIPDEYRVIGETATAEVDELVALARDRELTLIAALGASPLTDSANTICPMQTSARATLATGVDLVVLRGDGLVGGPACGIVLGNREVIRRITEHAVFAAWRLDPLRAAALVATLECYENTERGAEALPVWQFLTTPLENLRNRAERIAPQLSQLSGVASSVAIETRSPISAAMASDGGCSSYGIALAAADGKIDDLNKRLKSLPLPVVGRVEGDRLILDLRTVLPRQDRQLVESILGGPTSDTSQPSGAQ